MVNQWDKQDKAILALLQADASLSVGDIADIVGVSKSACWRRIQKMEACGLIRARVTLVDADQANLPLTAYILVRTNQHNSAWAQRFKEVISGIPEVLEVYRMSGDLDYLIKALVTDMRGYDRLYMKMIKVDMFDVSTSFVMETIKQTTQIPLDNLCDANR